MTFSDNLRSACQIGDDSAVTAILRQPRHHWENQLQEGLFEALSNSNRTVIGLLLSKGAKLDMSCFMISINRANQGVFEELLDHGFDLNSTEFGEPALRYASISHSAR